MAYIKKDGLVFPYTNRMLREDTPNTSFPAVLSDEIRAAYGVYPVTVDPTPDHDPATQVAEQGTPQETGGAWSIGWTVRDKNAEELAEYQTRMTERVQRLMGEKLEALAAGYERQERETWSTQVKEAEAIKAGSTTAPLLSSLAAGKGRTLDEQADRVLYLAQQFALASGVIMAARDALIAMDPIPADYAADTYWP